MKEKEFFEENIRNLDKDDYDTPLGIVHQISTLMSLPQKITLKIEDFSDWFNLYKDKLQGERYVNLAELIKKNSHRNGINWGKVFEKTFFFSIEKEYCDEAISLFLECINKNRGVRVSDIDGYTYFRKGVGHKTILRINPPGYGYRDDYTQFLLYEAKEDNPYSETNKHYNLSHKINFKQITTNEGVEDNWFEKKPEIITYLCKYADLIYQQNYYNKNNKEQMNKLEALLEQYIDQINKE